MTGQRRTTSTSYWITYADTTWAVYRHNL